MNEPKISVMVPVYQAERFLGECLDSILTQGVQDLEVVVSDDASKDKTAQILRSYEQQWPQQIKAFYNVKNMGITKNCNQALAACTGKYIALFAGDDVMLPGKLKTQLEFMEAQPDVVMSYHAGEIFDSDSGHVLTYTNSNSRLDTNNVFQIITKLGIAAPMSIMLRRAALPKGGYDETLRFVSDWLFQIEVASQGRVAKIPGIWCRYRKHGVNNGKELSSYLHEFEEVLRIVRSRYGHDPLISLACDQGLARFYAGEGFRCLSSDSRTSRTLLRSALKIDFRTKYLLAYLAAAVPGVSVLANKNKEWLKRLIG